MNGGNGIYERGSRMEYTLALPEILSDNTFGQLDRKYEQDGLTVKVYLPNIPESQRTKRNILIREKIVDIVSARDYDNVVNL